MAAARYWRFVGVETYAGGDLELSEIALYSGASRIDGPATLTCSHASIAGSLADLKDGSTSTACRFAAADVRSAGFYLQWDFGTATDVTEVRLGASASASRFMAAATILQGAALGAWTYVSAVMGIVYPGASTMTTSSAGGVLATTWNPLDKDAYVTLSNSNLTAASIGSNNGPVRSVFGASTGKWYWELTYASVTPVVGVALPSWVLLDYPGYRSNSLGFFGGATPKKIKDATQTNYGAAWASGVVLGVALNMDAGTIEIFMNGAPQGVMFSGLSGVYHAVSGSSASGSIVTANFGASALAYSPPVGHAAGFGESVLALPLTSSPVMHTMSGGAAEAASTVVGAYQTLTASVLRIARDVEFGGPGTIYGTTKTKGTPSNLPTKARVVLLHQRSKQPVRETWSDPVTGAFAFTGIDTNQQFLTLAEDAAGNFRPVAASRLVPEVLP